jgi:hypothetical protein
MSVERLLKALDQVEPGTGDVWLAEALWDEFYPQYIEARDALVAKALDPLVVDHVRKAALRSYVDAVRAGENPSGVVGVMLDDFAQMVDVAKAGQDQIQRDGWVQYVNRDERGRFSRRAVAGRRTPLATVYNRDREKLPTAVKQSGWTKGDGQDFKDQGVTEGQKKQVEEYLADWMQTRNLRAELLKRLDKHTRDNSTMIIHFKDRDTPDQRVPDWAKESGLRNIEHGLYDGRIDSYEVVPDNDLDGADLDRVARSLDAASKMDLLGAQNVTAEQMNTIMNILEPGSTEATRMSRMTGILRGASELASGVGMKDTGSMLRRAAVATEAGESLRPALTRAAYRYRGTEKPRPDREFVDAASFLVSGADDKRAMGVLTAPEQRAKPLPGDIVREAIAEVDRPVQAPRGGQGRTTELMPRIGQRLKMWQGDPQGRQPTTDQIRLGVQRDRVAEEFVRRQTRMFARRTKESTPADGSINTGIKPLRNLIQEIANGIGKDLPSEGVVIDANGRVVSQAVGVGGDHYNPFGLKARKAMSGGQYVRTRQLGGMTTDDIRTLLTTNARAGAVVSASGVFELEFDPSFRNQKRMSERALGMVDTYERILDQLAAEGIYARDLDPDKKAELRQQAKIRTARTGGDAKAEKKLYEELEAQARQDAMTVSADERKTIRADVEKIEGLTPRGVADEVQRRVGEKEKEKVRLLSLNSEGYEVALRTLQSYYPYFIREVSRRGVGDFMDASPAMGEAKLAHNLARAEKAGDKQYVLPGAVRSGNTMQAGAGLPEPKKKVWDPLKIGEEAQAAQAAQRNAEQPASGGGERPAAGGGREVAVEAPEQPAAQNTAEIPFAMKAVQDKARNNADRLYREMVGAIARQDGETGDQVADEFDAALAEWQNAHINDDLDETYKNKAFKGQTDEAGDAEMRRLLDLPVPNQGPRVLNELANWLSGKPERYDSMLAMIANGGVFERGGEASDDLMGAVDVAMAMSIAKLPWRAFDEKFNGRPAAIPELRDATSDAELYAGVKSAVDTALQGQYAYPGAMDSDELAKPSKDIEEIRTRLATLKNVRDNLAGFQEINDFLSTATANGTSLIGAPADVVAEALGRQNTDKVNSWALVRTGDAGVLAAVGDGRAEKLRAAASVDASAAAERKANADSYHSALFAALSLDAAELAANGLTEMGGDVVPKALAARSLPPQAQGTDEERLAAAKFLVNRIVFEKAQGSQRSRRGVPVARGSRWERLVKADLARGVPPQVAVLRRTRNSKR